MSMWGRLAEEPVFVLTGDQDWCPDWALADALTLAEDLGVPFHLFATSPTSVLPGPSDDGVTVGIHPNFLPGSSHGDTPAEVIATCQAMYPAATTIRSHCFAESTPTLRLLAAAGFTADSNLCLHLQPGIHPLMHASGMVRLPVYLEDDVMLWSGIPARLPRTLFAPGLKVLNFHPALIALNTPSTAAYDDARPALYGGGSPRVASGRGIRTFLVDLIQAVQSRGLRFESFPDIATEAIGAAAALGLDRAA